MGYGDAGKVIKGWIVRDPLWSEDLHIRWSADHLPQ
jgi:hypothetical protein